MLINALIERKNFLCLLSQTGQASHKMIDASKTVLTSKTIWVMSVNILIMLKMEILGMNVKETVMNQ